MTEGRPGAYRPRFFSPDTDPALFRCPDGCGRAPAPSDLLLETLDAIRERYGEPVRVTSGVRCAEHNRRVGGVPNSEHLTGEAADLAVPNGTARFYLITAALAVGVIRLGIGSTFVHVGVSRRHPQGVIWLYPSPRG